MVLEGGPIVPDTTEVGDWPLHRAIQRRLLLVLAAGACALLAVGLLAVTRSHHPVPSGSTRKIPTSLSCPQDRVCIAVDDLGGTLDLHDTSWSTPRVRERNGLSSISCASVTFCVAVGISGDAVTYDGFSWSSRRSIDRGAANYTDSFGTTGISGVSCPSTTFCVAVDGLGRAVRFNGNTWSAPLPIEPAAMAEADLAQRAAGIVGISCPTATFCGAVTGLGRVLTYGGHSWSTPIALEPAQVQTQALRLGIPALTGISCPAATRCVAVDSSGKIFTYNGSSWSGPTSTDPSSVSPVADGGLTAVSCPSVNFCVAVDASGSAVMYNSRSWSDPAQLDLTTGLAAVSCASDSFCVALNDLGEALTFQSGSWSSPRDIDI